MTTSQHFFAYGTLMAAVGADDPCGLGAAERRRLGCEGHLVGGATMAGLLHDLGSYPGLVEKVPCGEGSSGPTLVHGELWRLDDPAATFRWLDRYEGIDPAMPDAGEYRRVIRPVRVAGGTEAIAAWVYVFAGDAGVARPIAGGRWLDHLKAVRRQPGPRA